MGAAQAHSTIRRMQDIWPAAGHAHLAQNELGWLLPTPAYIAHWLARPELALVAESCKAERSLHRALQADPLRPVTQAERQALLDPDARDGGAQRAGVEARGGRLDEHEAQEPVPWP